MKASVGWLKATYDTQKMKVKSWLLPNEDFVKEMSFTWFVFHQRKYFYERCAASSSTLRIVHFLRLYILYTGLRVRYHSPVYI